MSSIHLNGHHHKTLASVFRHPAPHNVEWHDVLSLLKNLGSVTERHKGGFDVAIGDHTLVIERPKGHDLEGDQLRALKKFLTAAGLAPEDSAAPKPAAPPTAETMRTMIVLVDHHQARIFTIGDDGRAAIAPIVVVPDDPEGARRRIEHRQGNADHDGGHGSEDAGYYETICTALAGADRIVMLSDGKGRSSAGEYLLDHMTRHHAAMVQRIVATDRVDISHVSDGEIVAAGLALVSESTA